MRRALALLAVLSLTACVCADEGDSSPYPATFSIAACDSSTGEVGVAVQSKFLAVGAVVPFAKAKVGAIATQAYANVTFGPDGLALLEKGASPEEVVKTLTEADKGRARRQLGVVSASGKSATWTGKACNEWAGGIAEEGFCVQGNILAGEEVVKEMARAFKETKGDLGERMIAALEAGQEAGGDVRGKQSAALLIVREKGGFLGGNDRYRDLRVDDAKEPIAELRRIYRMHKQIFPPPAGGK